MPTSTTPTQHVQHSARQRHQYGNRWWHALLAATALIGICAWWWQRYAANQAAFSATSTEPATHQAQAAPWTARVAMQPAHGSQSAAPILPDREAVPMTGNPMPVYPLQALRARIEGSVTVRLHIDRQGQVSDARIVERSGDHDRVLDQAATGTLRHWRFEPAVRDGRTVVSSLQVPVEFKAGQ